MGGSRLSQIPFIVLNAVRSQELNEFIAKGNLLVMLLLLRDVTTYFLYIRLTQGKCSVAALPREIPQLGKDIMHPAAGVCLKIAQHIG